MCALSATSGIIDAGYSINAGAHRSVWWDCAASASTALIITARGNVAKNRRPKIRER